MFAKMYDADTGGYLGSGHISDSQYIVTYVPLSFIAIPYGDILGEIYPVSSLAMDISFFTYLGVAVELVQGTFKFRNQKKLEENPFLTWYKSYVRFGDGGTADMLKESYPAMLFRGYMKKLETKNPMYIKFGTKTLDDAEAYF